MWMYIFFGNGTKPNARLVLQTIWYATRPLVFLEPIPPNPNRHLTRSSLRCHHRSINAGLAGFLDAMVMGWRDAQPGRLTSQPHHTTSTDAKAGKQQQEQQHPPPERNGSLRSGTLSSGGPSVLELGAPASTLTQGPDDFEFVGHELTPVKARPRVVRRIFASTYNMVRRRLCISFALYPPRLPARGSLLTPAPVTLR